MNSAGWGRDLLDRLLGELVRSVDGAVGAGLTVSGDDGALGLASVGCAVRWDEVQRLTSSGPLSQAMAGEQVVICARVHGAGARRLGRRVEAGHHRLPGRAGRAARHRDGGSFRAVAGQRLRDVGVLRRGGDEGRADVGDDAIPARHRAGEGNGHDEARLRRGRGFAALAEASQHDNVRLRELAAALVEQVGGAPVEQPADPSAHLRPSEKAAASAERLWRELSV